MTNVLVFLLLFLSIHMSSASAAPLEPDAARREAHAAVADVLDALARKDFRRLATFTGDEGLLLSPYVMIDDGDVRLSRTEVENCATNPQVRHWGDKDGSGDPIEASCNRYFDEYVWNADYRQADEVLYNEPRQRGNDINNNHNFVPDGIVVELHIRGKSLETELEWKSLRLIFRKSERGLSFIAITRDVWTV